MPQTKPVAQMNQNITRLPITTRRMIYHALGGGLGVLGLGLLAAGLYLAPKPATLGLALLGLGLPTMLLLWLRPEFGLLAIIFLTSSLIPSDAVDLRLPIGGGLDLRDLVLIGMMGLLILRGLSHNTLLVPWWRVSAPLLAFLGCAIFSTMYALFYQHVESNWVLSDLRSLIFYCVFFVTAWVVTNRRQLAIVLIGLFIVSDILSGVLILQQFIGTDHPLLAAMSYTNWQMDVEPGSGSGGFGTVRIMPPGIALAYFAMVTAFCLMIFTSRSRRLRVILALQFVYLNFGLLLTYTRALWIASAIAMGVVLLVIFPFYKAYLTRYLLIGITVLGLLVGLLGTQLTQSISDSGLATAFLSRVTSIFTPEETIQSYSLQWRIFEQEEGLRSVSEHPLLGVGLGNSYRKVTLLQGEDLGWVTKNTASGQISRFTRFLHNSYLSIAVKMGLIGLVCFLWFCIAVVVSSAKLYRNLSDGQSKAIALAVPATFLGLMFWSFFHEHFIQTEGTATVGLIAGLAASLYRGIDGKNDLERLSHQVSARLHS
jgi:hypothetical protein